MLPMVAMVRKTAQKGLSKLLTLSSHPAAEEVGSFLALGYSYRRNRGMLLSERCRCRSERQTTGELGRRLSWDDDLHTPMSFLPTLFRLTTP